MKKVLLIIMTVLMLMLFLPIQTLNAKAAEEIKRVEIGTTVTGKHKDSAFCAVEYEVNKPGMVTITFSTVSDVTKGEFQYCLIDSHENFYGGYNKGEVGLKGWNSLGGTFKHSLGIYLEKGTYTYFFRCSGNGKYKITSEFKEVKESFSETNIDSDNTVSTANSIKLGKTYYGLVGLEDEDIYKFVVPDNRRIDVSVITERTLPPYISYDIYNENLEVIGRESLCFYSETIEFRDSFNLSSGTYYIHFYDFPAIYKIRVSDHEHTYDFKCATICGLCKEEREAPHIYTNECDEFCNNCGEERKITHNYKLTTTKATLKKNGKTVEKCTVCGDIKSTVTIYFPKTIKLSDTKYTYNGKAKKPSVTVKDSKGKALKKDIDYTVKYASGRKNTGKYTVTVTFKGKYSGTKKLTFNILPSKTSKITPTCTTTSIKASWKKVTGADGYKVELLNSKGKVVKTATTTKTAYTFKKLSKVTTYKVKVTAYKTIDKKKVYSTVSTTITTSTAPAKATLSKLTAGKKQLTATWKTVSGATGYEVVYSTSKKFTSKTTKKVTIKKAKTKKTTIKKLTKGKKYYVKVRAYKTVDGKKIYGAYSAVKNVKVK